MTTTKLSALTRFLEQRNLVDQQKIDSWMENGKLITSAKKEGNGVIICRLQYDAIFSVENYSDHAYKIIALVAAWINDNDEQRDRDSLPTPIVEIDIDDRSRADLEFRVTFQEDITLVRDENGSIPFDGEVWNLAPIDIYTAEEAAVGDNPDLPTDKPYQYGDEE